MKLEKQLSNKELSKRLRELGVPQESLFYWFRNRPDMEHRLEYGISEPWQTDDNDYSFSAFTVAELGEMFPDEVTPPDVMGEKQKTRNVQLDFWTEQVNDYYQVKRVYRVSVGSIQFKADTEADARAKMLIYLLENNLLTQKP